MKKITGGCCTKCKSKICEHTGTVLRAQSLLIAKHNEFTRGLVSFMLEKFDCPIRVYPVSAAGRARIGPYEPCGECIFCMIKKAKEIANPPKPTLQLSLIDNRKDEK